MTERWFSPLLTPSCDLRTNFPPQTLLLSWISHLTHSYIFSTGLRTCRSLTHIKTVCSLVPHPYQHISISIFPFLCKKTKNKTKQNKTKQNKTKQKNSFRENSFRSRQKLTQSPSNGQLAKSKKPWGTLPGRCAAALHVNSQTIEGEASLTLLPAIGSPSPNWTARFQWEKMCLVLL